MFRMEGEPDSVERMAERYRGVIAWALDHRAAMLTLATGIFLASFTLPAKGLSGFLAVLAGLALAVWGLTGRRSLPLRGGAVAGGLAAAIGLYAVVPAWGRVGVGFFPLDDRSEFNVSLETPSVSQRAPDGSEAPASVPQPIPCVSASPPDHSEDVPAHPGAGAEHPDASRRGADVRARCSGERLR